MYHRLPRVDARRAREERARGLGAASVRPVQTTPLVSAVCQDAQGAGSVLSAGSTAHPGPGLLLGAESQAGSVAQG